MRGEMRGEMRGVEQNCILTFGLSKPTPAMLQQAVVASSLLRHQLMDKLLLKPRFWLGFYHGKAHLPTQQGCPRLFDLGS